MTYSFPLSDVTPVGMAWVLDPANGSWLLIPRSEAEKDLTTEAVTVLGSVIQRGTRWRCYVEGRRVGWQQNRFHAQIVVVRNIPELVLLAHGAGEPDAP